MDHGVKIVGIGLNKTGTKTLGHYFSRWGFRNRTYDSNNVYESESFDLYKAGKIDSLLDRMADYDSFEDWPWPLIYREIDERYPEAKFVLTTRRSPEVWYRSLCNMTVRLGPLPLYEKHVYGWAMPQGHRTELIEHYNAHNEAVVRHFQDRPGKLLQLCWDNGDDASVLAEFLGLENVDLSPVHVNRSPTRVYDGDSLLRARLSGLVYRYVRRPLSSPRRTLRAIQSRISRT